MLIAYLLHEIMNPPLRKETLCVSSTMVALGPGMEQGLKHLLNDCMNKYARAPSLGSCAVNREPLGITHPTESVPSPTL